MICEGSLIRKKDEANAGLIAKAPSMHKKLQEFVELTRSLSANWENGDLAERVNAIGHLSDEVEEMLAA